MNAARTTVAAARICAGACLLLLGISLAWGQGTVLEVFALHYRTADQIIPVVRPLLAPGGTVTGFQGQLVVRTTPGNLEEVRRVLADIDTAPRRLLITVRQTADTTSDAVSMDVTGRVGTGNGDGTVREATPGLQARVLDTRSAENDRNTQTVQAIEGAPAFIHVGQSVPLDNHTVVRAQSGSRVVERVTTGTEYREVGAGFYALPRIAGNQVTLEISPHRDQLSGQYPGRVDVQRAMTTVTGRIGEWIEVAGVARSSSGQQSVVLGRTSYRSGEARRVLVKVEEIR